MNEENLHEVEITVKAPKGDDSERIVLPELEKLPAVVKSIKPKDTKKGIRANFCFELKGEYVGEYAWGSVPHREVLSEDSHLYQWSAAILGRKFGIGDNFKLKELVGKPVSIIIEDTPNGEDPDKPFQNVVKVLARKVSAVDKAVKKKVEELEEDEEIEEETLTESVASVETQDSDEADDDDFDLFD